MANTQVDIAVVDIDEKDIAATAAGTVTNGVRVVFDEGVDRKAACIALRMIVAKVESGGITLS
jgi:hypothetical protein